MAIIRTVSTPDEHYDASDHVIDIKDDAKLKLQIETKQALKELASSSTEAVNKQQAKQELTTLFDELTKDSNKDLSNARTTLDRIKTDNNLTISSDLPADIMNLPLENINAFAEQQFNTRRASYQGKSQDTETIATDFNNQLKRNTQEIKSFINTLKNNEILSQDMNESYRFELHNLQSQTQEQTKALQTTLTPARSWDQGPVDASYDKKNSYGAKTETFILTEGPRIDHPNISWYDKKETKVDVENTFKNKISKDTIENLFGVEGKEKRDFFINLSIDKGLAGLVLFLEEHKDNGQSIWDNDDFWNNNISPKQLRDGIQFGSDTFVYKKKGGLDNEAKKVCEILLRAKQNPETRKELLDFAYLAKSAGSGFEKRITQAGNFNMLCKNGVVTESNILFALCDFNADGSLAEKSRERKLSEKEYTTQWEIEHNTKAIGNQKETCEKDYQQYLTDYKADRKFKRKNVENQGDVGTIFGGQLADAINTAIERAQTAFNYNDATFVKYAKEQGLTNSKNKGGEKVVIHNILNHIASLTKNPDILTLIKAATINSCDQATLFDLASKNPEFQALFAQAIAQINGSSSAIAPDLVDSLVGISLMETAQDVISLQETREQMIDKNLKTPQGQQALNAYQKTIKSLKNADGTKYGDYSDDGYTEVKNRLMNVLDNVNIGAALATDASNPFKGETFDLKSIGINKSWDIKKQQHELENSFAKDLLGAGISFVPNPLGGGLNVSWGKQTISEDLSKKYGRNINLSGTHILKGGTGLGLSLGGEMARETNQNAIITANLADVGTGIFVGVEGGLSANVRGQKLFNNDKQKTETQFAPNAGVNVGVNIQRDKKVAIEQMYNQYGLALQDIFDLKKTISGAEKFASKNTLESEASLHTFLSTRLRKQTANLTSSEDKKEQSIGAFLTNNTAFLESNISNVVHAIEMSGARQALLTTKDYSDKQKQEATSSLLDMLGQGMRSDRREQAYEHIQGNIHVKEFGVGVGANFNLRDFSRGPYVKFALGRWKNQYTSNDIQKQVDASAIASGKGYHSLDVFSPEPPSIEAYAGYLESIFHIGEYVEDENNPGTKKFQSFITCEEGKDAEKGKLVLRVADAYENKYSLFDLVDMRVAVRQTALDNVQLTEANKKLIVGDLGTLKMRAYTQSDQSGKRCFLLLGTETAENTKRLDLDYHKDNTNIKDFECPQSTGVHEWTAEDVDSDFAALDPRAKEYLKTNMDTWKNTSEGNLLVTKHSDSTISLQRGETPNDGKLHISSQEMRAAQEGDKNTVDGSSKEASYDFDLSTNYSASRTLLDNAYSDAHFYDADNTTDRSHKIAFNNFIKNTSNEGGTVHNPKETIQQLAIIVGTNNPIIKQMKNASPEEQAYLINGLKQIFALNSTNQETAVSELLSKRNGNFLGLSGPSGEQITTEMKSAFEEIHTDRKAEVAGSDKKLNSYSKNKHQDLIAYTGFYRSEKASNGKRAIRDEQARKYSLTPLGETNVLVQENGEEFLNNLEGNAKKEAQHWLVENLKKNPTELKHITSTILGKIKALYTLSSGQAETQVDINALLNGDNCTISLANGEKKIIRLESACVFFLMAECANESIGLVPGDIIEQEVPGNEAKVDAEARKSYDNMLIGKNMSSSAVVGSYEQTMGAKVSLSGIVTPYKKQKIGTTDPGATTNGAKDQEGGETQPGVTDTDKQPPATTETDLPPANDGDTN